jgi:tetratricopeptide (TPR) repeat protein
VNLAARLMTKAPPGEIYATASVLDRCAARFQTVELEPFMVKGKAQPIQAWSLGPPVAGGGLREARADRFPLVGRGAEMAVLREALSAARAGEVRLVEIVGEAGAGKSRLLQEVRDEAGDFVVTGATGETFTASTPYVAWRDILRELSGLAWEDSTEVVIERLGALVRQRAPDLVPWLPLIAVTADAEMPPTPQVADLAPEFVRPKLHEMVEAFLRATNRAPTLFVLEDAHSMDRASADLLSAIAAAETGPRHWLFIVCRRPSAGGFEAPQSPAIRRLILKPLADEDSVALAEAATEETPIPDHVLRDATARSGGNPQLLLDLLRAVGLGEGSLPDSVESAATVTIDSMPPSDRSLIRRLSVFGLAFHPRFVPDVLDDGAPMPDEATWDRIAGFFEAEGSGYLRFRRAVIRDAAYAGLPFRTRRRLHGVVGHRLERETDVPDDLAGLLAMHFSMAGEDERALHYASVAAARAREIFANVEAASQYTTAIEAAKRAQTSREALLDLYEALGDVWWRARLKREALEANTHARALARDDPVTLARLMLKRSIIEEMTGRLSQCLSWLSRARTLVVDLRSNEAMQLVAELDARYASGLQAQGRNRETQARATRAIGEAERSGSVSAMGYAENLLGIALTNLGQPGAIDQFRKALAHFEEIADLRGQAIVLANMGVGGYFEGRWTEAVELYGRAAQVSERVGDPVQSAISKMNSAEVLVDQGFTREAESLFREATRVWRTTGDNYNLGFCLVQLGRVAGSFGRMDEALERLEQARERYQFVGALGQVPEVDAREVECQLLDGRAQGALARLDEIEGRLEVEGGVNVLMPLLGRLRGYALAQLDRMEEARTAFEASVAHARERGAEHEVALSLQGLARIARIDGAPARAIEEQTGAIFEQLGIRAVPVFPMKARG